MFSAPLWSGQQARQGTSQCGNTIFPIFPILCHTCVIDGFVVGLSIGTSSSVYVYVVGLASVLDLGGSGLCTCIVTLSRWNPVQLRRCNQCTCSPLNAHGPPRNPFLQPATQEYLDLIMNLSQNHRKARGPDPPPSCSHGPPDDFPSQPASRSRR